MECQHTIYIDNVFIVVLNYEKNDRHGVCKRIFKNVYNNGFNFLFALIEFLQEKISIYKDDFLFQGKYWFLQLF